MSDKNTTNQGSTNQNGQKAGTNPFEDTLGRVRQLIEETSKLEQNGAEQLRSAVDEYARLVKAQLDYSMKLTTEWRNLAMSSAQRMMDMTQTFPGAR